MTVEWLISLVKLRCQAKPDDVVVSYHCDRSILLPVVPQQCLHLLRPPPQICGSLVDKRFLHVLEDQLHNFGERFLFVGFDYLSVLCLIFLTFIGEHPECPKPFNF
jgi:hypothetical protein